MVVVGERVLLCAPNSPELAIAYFAVHAAGGVAVLLDADVPAESLRWIAEDAEARLALCWREIDLPAPVANLAAWCGEGSEVGEQRSESRGQRSEVADPTSEIGFPTSDLRLPTSDSAADLIYTTGTTGRKKGVLLTHRSIAQAALNINAFVGTCRDDLEVMPLPLSHSFGLGRLRAMALAGHCLLLLPGMRNPATVLKQLLDAKATGLALVPAGFDLILRMTRDRLGDAREHLRYIEIGSAAMRPETRQKLLDLLPRTRICHHYGLTEASRAAFLEYHADHDHLASIGRPSPNVEMAVRDDEGHDLTDGQEGEICVRGGMVMQQYWKQPELTRDALRRREGDRHPPCDAQESLSDVAWGVRDSLSPWWLRTGDRGYRDADGYYYLTGRQGDLVNVGGRKVNPEEVEQALNAQSRRGRVGLRRHGRSARHRGRMSQGLRRPPQRNP